MSQQAISLALLGVAGYAIFKRSQIVNKSVDSAPLHPDQETNARKFVLSVVSSNINALGDYLQTAINKTNWVNMDQTDINDSTIIQFASDYQPITYGQLVQMNGLQVMQLANLARLNPDKSPVIFDLASKKVQNPISSDAIEDVTKLLDK